MIWTISRYFNTEERLTNLLRKISNEIIIEQMRNEKILTVKASDNIIRLLPPLILQISHVDEAIEKLKKALSKI